MFRDDRSELIGDERQAEMDAAVEWIGVVRDELVNAGGAGGDRDVALANLRAVIAERGELRRVLAALLAHHEEHPDHEYGEMYRCERPEADAARALFIVDLLVGKATDRRSEPQP